MCQQQQPLCFCLCSSLEEMRQCPTLPSAALQIISQCASWTQEVILSVGASVSGAEAPEDKKDCFHLSLGTERLHRHYPCPPLGRELGLYSGVWAWSVGRATEQNPSCFSRHACPELSCGTPPRLKVRLQPAQGTARASPGEKHSCFFYMCSMLTRSGLAADLVCKSWQQEPAGTQ